MPPKTLFHIVMIGSRTPLMILNSHLNCAPIPSSESESGSSAREIKSRIKEIISAMGSRSHPTTSKIGSRIFINTLRILTSGGISAPSTFTIGGRTDFNKSCAIFKSGLLMSVRAGPSISTTSVMIGAKMSATSVIIGTIAVTVLSSAGMSCSNAPISVSPSGMSAVSILRHSP